MNNICTLKNVKIEEDDMSDHSRGRQESRRMKQWRTGVKVEQQGMTGFMEDQ